MEYGLKDIKLYVQKQIAPQAICYNPTLVRKKPLGVPTFVRWVCSIPKKKLREILIKWNFAK